MKTFGLLVLVVAAAAAGYFYWIHTPNYALDQAGGAIQSHSLTKFNQWVDSKTLSDALVDDLLSEPVKQVGGLGILERLVGLGVVSILRPTVSGTIQHQIEDYVGKTPEQAAAEKAKPKGVLEAVANSLKPPPLSEVLADAGFKPENFKKYEQVEGGDRQAKFNATFEDAKNQKLLTVQFTLNKDSNNQWKVVRISEMREVARELAHK